MYGESPSALVKCHQPVHHGAVTWVFDTVWYLSSSPLARAVLTQSRDFFSGGLVAWGIGEDVGSLSMQALGGCAFLRDSPSSVPAGSSETWPGLWSTEVGCLYTATQVGEFYVRPLLCAPSTCVLLC